ncbi:hypothetical protein Tsubulata_045400 [Turnera subulata]|uniref:RRM domain-containing protein n=1 Tax=Turnera subulata TaxID=218843 RepID=A0A9Q0JKQ4_9ROSI|nr:hypothetical protein Tsubulata_045400 [Turnera subulata]
MGPTLPYFSKWSRRQVQGAMDNGLLHSLYVKNLSETWKPTDIYRIMSKYREAVDVYVPNKRTRSGKRFGFVRFRGILDLQRLLSDVNRVHVEEGVVRASVARLRNRGPSPVAMKEQQQAHRVIGASTKVLPGGTYANVVLGRGDDRKSGSHLRESQKRAEGKSFIPSTDVNCWLARCAVGIVRDPLKMESVYLLWKLHDMTDVVVEDMGGDSVLVCFSSKDSMLAFSQRPPDWVSLWFRSFAPWKQGDRTNNRRCWVTVRGVPLNAWCQEFFEMVGSKVGRFLRVDSETVQRQRLGVA